MVLEVIEMGLRCLGIARALCTRFGIGSPHVDASLEMRPIFDADAASGNVADDGSSAADFHAIADGQISP